MAEEIKVFDEESAEFLNLGLAEQSYVRNATTDCNNYREAKKEFMACSGLSRIFSFLGFTRASEFRKEMKDIKDTFDGDIQVLDEFANSDKPREVLAKYLKNKYDIDAPIVVKY